MASNKKNLASGKLVGSISASTTSLVVNVGSGTNPEIVGVWPDAPFYITAMPSNPSAGVPNSLDSEIMSVSAVGTDGNGNTTLTVSRAKNGTTAKAFSDGSIITSAVYSDDAVFWEEGASSETPSPWIETGDIKDGQITSAKIADGAVTDAKIDWSSMPVATGAATVNSTYITHGGISWKKIGRIVFLLVQDMTITADIPAGSNTIAASGVPIPHSSFNYNLMNISTPKSSRILRFRLQDDKLYFHWTNGAAAAELDGEYAYVSAS